VKNKYLIIRKERKKIQSLDVFAIGREREREKEDIDFSLDFFSLFYVKILHW